MTDIKTTADCDLDLTIGLVVASDKERDRHMTIVRSMTVRGEVPPVPTMGVSDFIIGKSITPELITQIEQEVMAALMADLGLTDTNPTIRVVPTGPNKVAVLIQINKDYGDNLGKSVLVGDYWNRDEDMTLLDGSIG